MSCVRLPKVTMPGHFDKRAEGRFAQPIRAAYSREQILPYVSSQARGRLRCRNAAIASFLAAAAFAAPRLFGVSWWPFDLAVLTSLYLAMQIGVGAIRPGSLLDRVRPRGVGRVNPRKA